MIVIYIGGILTAGILLAGLCVLHLANRELKEVIRILKEQSDGKA